MNKSGERALHVAAELGHLEIVRCLLVNGSSVQEKNDKGRTTCTFLLLALISPKRNGEGG